MKKKCYPALFVFLMFIPRFAQADTIPDNNNTDLSIDWPRWLQVPDSLHPGRMRLLVAGGAAAYSATLVGLNYLWYADYPRSSFHFFDDSGEWLQVDKAGHAVTPYLEAYYLMHALRWTGIERKKAAVYGGLTAFMLQNTIEVFDGFSEGWGASLSDVAANFAGAALMTSQELTWGEQRIRLKIMPHFQSYPEGELSERAQDLFGKSLLVRFFKDYNALNTWASVNLYSFNPEGSLPPWLNVAIGYGAGGMYGGYDNIWTDKNGLVHDRSDIVRYRRFFLSPDIDFSRIKTRSPYIKILLEALNIIKVPLPTIEYNTKGEFKLHPIM
ncbi:MAG: hypothetical protein PWP35_1231 [Bacteroidales bacterium]|jgi:hypothetical protein|nr:hypothetical protein [Bacteroidales bacterium]